jgi:type IV secretion system protein VirD4
MFPPDKLDTYFRFARLMVQCFFNKMAQTPAALDRPVLALLDEQAKLRYMEIIETSVALLRGYRVRIWSIFQDINQIKSIYKDAWETFISNAGIIQVMTPNDATTAEYISRRIGNETITEYRYSSNTPARHPAAPQTGGSSGSAENVFGRPLLSPQDLYAMPPTVSLILRQGNPNPIMATRECYHETEDTETFYGIPYAPHPVHNPEAFDVMKATIKPK